MNKHFLIQRKVLITMIFLASSLLGVISYKQLKMEIMPNAELPMLFVQVGTRMEMTPEYLEQEAIVPIESAIAGLENIEEIESSAGRNRGSIMISYEQQTDLNYAYLKLEEKMASLKGLISDEFTINVQKADLESTDNTLMKLQALGEGGQDRIRNIVDQHIAPQLTNIDGVANINVYGGRQKSVDIILNRDMCEAYNISPARVKDALSRNMNFRQYGGHIEDRGMRYFIYLNAEYESIKQIEELMIGRSGNAVQLKDIAEVYYGEKEEESISRINGMDAISLEVINDAQANIIDVSHAVRDQIKKLNKENEAVGIEIILQEDNAETMEKNIDQIINLALLGGLLAVFILWIFLRNVRLVTIIALAMPVSIFTAFNFFYAADISINSLTLMGIALAVGMLLDTSVVVLENIYRLRSLGFGIAESVVRGTSEVWRAIVASTLTTIAVFVPFVFSSNYLVELLGKHIGVSIISTLLISLLVSLLLIPMVVNLILSKVGDRKAMVYQEVSLDKPGIRFYQSMLKTALRNPAAVIILVVILFFATIVISTSVSVNKLEELETDQIILFVTMRSGSTLENADDVVSRMEEKIMQVPEYKQVISNIEDEEATLTIILKEDFESINKKSYAEIESEIEKMMEDMPVADISTSASYSGGGGSSGRSGGGGNEGLQRMMGIGEDEEYLVLKGQNFELMVEVAEDIETYLEDLDNISSARVSVRDNQPEVHIDMNSLIMSDYGVTISELRNELGSFDNEISSDVNFRQGDEEYEIMIKYDDYDEEDQVDKNMEDLRELKIPDANDESDFELQELAEVYYARGLREISRVNQEKQVRITYSYDDEVYDSKDLLEFARSEIEDVIANANIPTGIAVELVQEESEMDEFKSLFLIALLLVYMILAALFESFVTPFVLLLSIPLAAIGSFFLLTVTGNSLFNANTMMGFLILLGVVVNNAIILIDVINQLRKQGMNKTKAIMLGGMSRVRPILITTITTCVALLPLALGQAEYVKAIGPPFAITVIGGLSVSTVLTLVFIPMMYSGLEEALSWFKKQGLTVVLILTALVITGLVLVTLWGAGLLVKIGVGLAVVVGIPLAYWFVTSSLRKASERIIPEEEELKIQISNLVKIYGRRSKASREFFSARLMNRKAGSDRTIRHHLDALIWEIPLLAFLVYFTWFYLVSGFWQLMTSVVLYVYILQIIWNLNTFLKFRMLNWLFRLILYVAPLLISLVFFRKWDNLSLTLIVGFFWYLVLAIRYTGLSLKRRKVEIRSVRKVFRWFYKLVSVLPFIGNNRDEFKALKGVSLEIGTGMFGLLGPNGAGKSTMIRVICGILEQSYGKIWINGIDTQEKREELQGLIGYLPQEFGMYENMTAEAYLEYQALMKGIADVERREERIREVLESVHMWEHRKKKIGTYSGGMKQRIGIAQVLLHLPRILVVDEPTAGLDPRERIRFRNLLVELSRSRIVIFSTHIIEDISSSCRTMAVINKGDVVYTGSPAELTELAKGKVWRTYHDSSRFEEETKDMLVIHHMREGEKIRARCVSANKPFETAVEELPMLEDAYLWLLRKN